MADFIDLAYIIASDLDVNPALGQGDNKLHLELINRAMFDDVRPLLGDELYWDLVNNPSITTRGSYPNLLNGSTYVYNGYTYNHPGIKEVTLMFWHARYKFFSMDIDTAHGYGQIQGDHINKTPESRTRWLYDSALRSANKVWGSVEDYLDRNIGDYDYWFGSHCIVKDGESNININKGTLS